MNTVNQGRVGEAKILAHFVQNNYQVYMPMFGNTDVDMIVCKNGLFRVEVKSTSYSDGPSWVVQIKSVRPNKTKNVIKAFDASKCDLIAAYIVPEDRVEIFEAKDYDGKNIISIRKQ